MSDKVAQRVKRLRIEKRYTNFAGRRFAAVVDTETGDRIDVIIREYQGALELYGSAREIKVAAATKFLALDERRAREADEDPFDGLS